MSDPGTAEEGDIPEMDVNEPIYYLAYKWVRSELYESQARRIVELECDLFAARQAALSEGVRAAAEPAVPLPAGTEYVLLEDMVEGHHKDFGSGLFTTHNCVKVIEVESCTVNEPRGSLLEFGIYHVELNKGPGTHDYQVWDGSVGEPSQADVDRFAAYFNGNTISPRPTSTQAAAEPEGWQPIDTAPKGVKILVAYKNSLGNWRRVLARWYGEDELESCDSDNESGFAPAGWYEESETQEDIRVTDESPEFWHTIPAPPSTKLPAQGDNND